MRVFVQYPRFRIDLTGNTWESSKAYGYKSVRKMGYDEDPTTLAVNAFLEFVERETVDKLVLSVGECEFNFGVFLEATGRTNDNTSMFHGGELAGISGLITAKEREAHFLVVDAPQSVDIQSQIPLSAAAVICSTSDLKVDSEIDEVDYSQKPRYSRGELLVDDANLVSIYKKNKVSSDVLLISNLRLARGFKQATFDVQKSHGYSGAVTPVLEGLYSLEVKEAVIISATDGVKYITVKLRGTPEIIESSSSDMELGKYMQRYMMDEDPGHTPQGAYISTPSYLASKESRYRLRADQCTDCSRTIFPPRLRCKYCNGKTEKGKFLNRYGTVYTITNILKGAAPTEFDRQQSLEGEYLVGIVELEDNVRIISQITDSSLDDLDVGDSVKMVFRKIYHQDSMDRYGYKFVKT